MTLVPRLTFRTALCALALLASLKEAEIAVCGLC